MKKYLLGIDIGGTTVKLGLFNINGELLNKWEIETRKIDNGKYILSDIKACEQQLAKLTDTRRGIKDPYLAKKFYNKFLLSINGDFKHVLFDNNKFAEYDKAYDDAKL